LLEGPSSSLDKHISRFSIPFRLNRKKKENSRIARSLPFLILRPVSLFRADRNIFCSLHSDLGTEYYCLSLTHTPHGEIYRHGTGRTQEARGSKRKDTAYIPGVFCVIASLESSKKQNTLTQMHSYIYVVFLVSEVMCNKAVWEIQTPEEWPTYLLFSRSYVQAPSRIVECQ
jgi:hypothetical protein